MATPPDFTVGQVLTAAQMNQIGLWKVTPTSVSGTGASIQSDGSVLVASGGNTFTITGCFNGDFEAYQIVITDMTLSTDSSIFLQLRTGSTTSATAYYYGWLIGSAFYNGTGTTASSLTNQTVYDARILATTGGGGGGVINIFFPFLSKPTTFATVSSDARTGGAAVFGASGFHNVSTSYTSLVFTNSPVANFTRCRVSIYGYN